MRYVSFMGDDQHSVDEYPHAAVGKRLAWIRSFSTPNKQKYAASLGVDQSAWVKYEQGERALPLRIGVELARKNRITLDFIYRGQVTGLLEVWKARLLDDPHGSDLIEPTDMDHHRDI